MRRNLHPGGARPNGSPTAASGSIRQHCDGQLERGAGRDRRPGYSDQAEPLDDGGEERPDHGEPLRPPARSPTATW